MANQKRWNSKIVKIVVSLFLAGIILLFLFPPIGLIFLAAAVLVGISLGEKIVRGAVCVLLGLSIYLYASQHSPHMGFGEALTRSGSYYINEPLYSVVIVVAASLSLTGIVLIGLGVKEWKV